jgi:apolipoprotein N-acyltransferase
VSRYGLAAASGILLALSFPKYGHPAFAWMALAPLLVALAGIARQKRRPIARAFACGLTTGVIYFSGTLYWITRVMAVYGGLQGWVAVLINAALVAYLALFPAIFAMVVARLMLAHGTRALIAAPFVWTATELGRTHLFTGFPWVLLGYGEVTVLPIAQLASVTGVYGLSALVAGASAAAAYAALAASSPSRGSILRPYRPLLVVLTMIVAVAVWGSVRIRGGALLREGQPVKVGLLQGNVEQSERENPASAPQIFQNYLQMTRRAIDKGAEVVFWPESATPFYFEDDRAGAEQVRAIARQFHDYILLGSDQIGWRTQNGQLVPDKYFNSAFLVRPDGATAGFYRKMHLVPFGEYVPLKRLFFFAAPLVQAVSDFSPGENAALLPVNGHLMSTAICYEIVYPDLVRQFVSAGSELLSTITNDSWFGRTSAPYQHFAQASMRAIEEGRYLVRSANTGISGIVDPYGRVLVQTRIYETAVVVGEARFLKAATVYAQTGDVFAYASVALTIAALVVSRRRVQ